MARRPMPDALDRRILAELEKDARVSQREIARRLRVSPPTVGYRLRRMEEAGLITGYRVETAGPRREDQHEESGGKMRCAHCKDPIHGPAVTGRFWNRTHAFCCRVCLAAFSDRHPGAPSNVRKGGALVVALSWLASFGVLGVACLGAGAGCIGQGVMAQPSAWSCGPWARPRDEWCPWSNAPAQGWVAALRRHPTMGQVSDLRGPLAGAVRSPRPSFASFDRI